MMVKDFIMTTETSSYNILSSFVQNPMWGNTRFKWNDSLSNNHAINKIKGIDPMVQMSSTILCVCEWVISYDAFAWSNVLPSYTSSKKKKSIWYPYEKNRL